MFNRKAALERKNLINLTKLIVKDLISSSLASGRTIENDTQSAIHLKNYFTLVDRVLKHGLKQNILSNRSAALWSTLDGLSKNLQESTLMSESIRSLAHTKSPDGKIRAWIRLAMMQKRLPEYFNELMVHRDNLLKDIYLDFAFMLNEEAPVFAGLIIGVNVIDCNFFVKDENFDCMEEIIDLDPYLRPATSSDEDKSDDSSCHVPTDPKLYAKQHEENLTKILDQKNYLEEWKKHLESTITNLHAKIRSLEEKNSMLEMDARLSEVRMAKLKEKAGEGPSQSISNESTTSMLSSTGLNIPDAIKTIINRGKQKNVPDNSPPNLTSNDQDGTNKLQNSPVSMSHNDSNSNSSRVRKFSDTNSSIADTETKDSTTSLPSHLDPGDIGRQLVSSKNKICQQEKEILGLRERIGILETSYRSALDKIRALEHDLDVRTSMNSDKETTIKIYEKDIREKQKQVESLRESLADAKKLNSDLSDRLHDTSVKLKERLKSVSSLQSSLDKWKLENKTLANRLQERQTAFINLTKEMEKSVEQIKDLKKYNEKINDDLRRERECGQNCSVTVEEQNTKIDKLTERLKTVEKELAEISPYRDQYETLKKRCQDYEQSLEEVGAQLRESRLEVENLKEYSSVFLDSEWMDSKQVKQCALCQNSFSVTRRKHHCRLCGNVFCQTCSDNKMELASSAKPVRVCDTCHAFLLAKFVKAAASTSLLAST